MDKEIPGVERSFLMGAVAMLVLGACSGDGPSPPSQASVTPVPSRTSEPLPTQTSFACTDQEAVISDADLRLAGSLTGAVVEGTGRDVVGLAVDDAGTQGCRAFLVVESSGGVTLSTPIDVEGMGSGFPRLGVLARIDERPGAEIVVHVLAGASTEFVAVFSAGGGELERMTIEGQDPYGDLFPSGGSVGHLEASDCASNAGDDGYVVVSIAEPRGDAYRVTRNFYESSGGTFSHDETTRDRISDPQDLEMYQEFIGTPFGTCAAGS